MNYDSFTLTDLVPACQCGHAADLHTVFDGCDDEVPQPCTACTCADFNPPEWPDDEEDDL